MTVRVFPDGKYLMQFRSQGDKKDIYDNDFKLPLEGDWTSEITKKENSNNETIHIISTEAFLLGKTIFHPSSEGPSPVRHPINIKKINKIFSTSYGLKKVFEGRRINRKYPLLAQAIADGLADSTNNLVETEIIMYCLRMGMNDLEKTNQLESLLKERILNHFKGVFSKAEEEENLFRVLGNNNNSNEGSFILPIELIRTQFSPFELLLPPNFIEKCIKAMGPYIDEANITIKLRDDTFKFAGILPGLITESNADSIANDTLWWSFNAEDFINDDYIIEAASIVYHPKRIQIAIIAGSLLTLSALFFISRKRKSQ